MHVDDARLARIVRHCQDLPGQALFQFINDAGEVESIDSSDVNAYIRGRDGLDFSAKDFRTWAGTLLTARVLAELGNAPNEPLAKARITSAIEQVAGRLGNTPAICRKSYVHPAILDAYLANTLKLPPSTHALGKRGCRAGTRHSEVAEAAGSKTGWLLLDVGLRRQVDSTGLEARARQVRYLEMRVRPLRSYPTCARVTCARAGIRAIFCFRVSCGSRRSRDAVR